MFHYLAIIEFSLATECERIMVYFFLTYILMLQQYNRP